jgi:hypothetical protein
MRELSGGLQKGTQGHFLYFLSSSFFFFGFNVNQVVFNTFIKYIIMNLKEKKNSRN